MSKRLKGLILSVTLCASLAVFTSCEEDSEIFDNVEVEKKKETDNDGDKGSSPSGN